MNPTLPICGILVCSLLVAGTVMSAGAPDPPRPPLPSAPLQLLGDPGFRRGFHVWGPVPGKKVRSGTIQPDVSAGEPVWGLAQWHSRLSIAGARPQKRASGEVRFANEGKTVLFRPGGDVDAGVVLGVYARTEYRGKPHRKGTPWVHLLAEQKLQHHPALVDLKRIRFRIRYRLLKAKSERPPNWDRKIHSDAAQFLAYVTVQNRNPASPGHGDFVWFGIPMYDSRWRTPKAHAALDKGTGKFIYNPAGETYTKSSAHDGEWITIDHDLLPLMIEAVKTAWQRGFLTKSRDLADFRLGGFNMGWEVPGLHDVVMEVKGLGLTATPKRPQ